LAGFETDVRFRASLISPRRKATLVDQASPYFVGLFASGGDLERTKEAQGLRVPFAFDAILDQVFRATP